MSSGARTILISSPEAVAEALADAKEKANSGRNVEREIEVLIYTKGTLARLSGFFSTVSGRTIPGGYAVYGSGQVEFLAESVSSLVVRIEKGMANNKPWEYRQIVRIQIGEPG